MDNLDCYDIVQSKFAASLQKRVAASASGNYSYYNSIYDSTCEDDIWIFTIPVVVQSSSNPNEKQVFIQGDMTKTIVYLLTGTYITITETCEINIILNSSKAVEQP